ncbi:HAD superfamily hydrolase [Grosmannia clavigera kw1407]|uniref:HAD superfamily hydrolase n=1 Tax=Grosmannia clavigera (strain kw1407 / UAMH 11150) TaxID=655863 RepID=F0XJ42_GROCL|nr:HAD superfamily hydrolase [Grosmannia clavigera kw1407]EFX02268.1 HAD superfamily hydrolase [Grosmannia clavigera kw1407]
MRTSVTKAGWAARQLQRPAAGPVTFSAVRASPGVCNNTSGARSWSPPDVSCRRRHYSTTHVQTTTAPIPLFAFAFDIDGVLLHVNEPIPGAAAALRHLHGHGIPFILLTNGGGRYEADRVADLERRLGLELQVEAKDAAKNKNTLPVLSTENFVQSHTPFQELIEDVQSLDDHQGRTTPSVSPSSPPAGLRDQTILVTGSDAARARTIAERYGFRSVVTPADLLAAYPTLYPFDPLLASVYANTARPLPKPLLLEGGKQPAATASELDDRQHLRIAAAFVFNDPRDWALDIQLLTDLLQSRQGFLGTYDPEAVAHSHSHSPSRSMSPFTPPRIFFSNGDLLWATTYHLPRLGQGAFAAAVSGVWAQLAHGQEMVPHRATLLGKPNPATYRYAERVLLRYRDALLREIQHDKTPSHAAAVPQPLQTVYMVGDNPESDIAGANQFRSAHGTDWCSVLVGTGVYNAARDGTSAEHLRHRPRVIVDDVGAAVRWALQREGWPADF